MGGQSMHRQTRSWLAKGMVGKIRRDAANGQKFEFKDQCPSDLFTSTMQMFLKDYKAKGKKKGAWWVWDMPAPRAERVLLHMLGMRSLPQRTTCNTVIRVHNVYELAYNNSTVTLRVRSRLKTRRLTAS